MGIILTRMMGQIVKRPVMRDENSNELQTWSHRAARCFAGAREKRAVTFEMPDVGVDSLGSWSRVSPSPLRPRLFELVLERLPSSRIAAQTSRRFTETDQLFAGQRRTFHANAQAAFDRSNPGKWSCGPPGRGGELILLRRCGSACLSTHSTAQSILLPSARLPYPVCTRTFPRAENPGFSGIKHKKRRSYEPTRFDRVAGRRSRRSPRCSAQEDGLPEKTLDARHPPSRLILGRARPTGEPARSDVGVRRPVLAPVL